MSGLTEQQVVALCWTNTRKEKKEHFARGFSGYLLVTRDVEAWGSESVCGSAKSFAASVPVLSSPSFFLDENAGREKWRCLDDDTVLGHSLVR